MVRESDAFDDDADHWGVVQDQEELPPRRRIVCMTCAWWLSTRLLFMLVFVLFMVWTGQFFYG